MQRSLRSHSPGATEQIPDIRSYTHHSDRYVFLTGVAQRSSLFAFGNSRNIDLQRVRNNINCAAAGDETARSKSTVDAPITLFSELKNLKLVAEDAGAENIPAYPQTQANDTCTLLFSSGTTGLSKAVQLTHANFISAITAYNTLEPGQSTMETDVCLAIIPMFHVYGLGIVMLATLERGASVEKYRITVATIVPPIIVSLVKSAEVAKYDLSSLRIIATGWKSFTLSLSTILNQSINQSIARQSAKLFCAKFRIYATPLVDDGCHCGYITKLKKKKPKLLYMQLFCKKNTI
jgi:acyl-CoA synthetase (AMP-forming)/AMP-acid ligase II